MAPCLALADYNCPIFDMRALNVPMRRRHSSFARENPSHAKLSCWLIANHCCSSFPKLTHSGSAYFMACPPLRGNRILTFARIDTSRSEMFDGDGEGGAMEWNMEQDSRLLVWYWGDDSYKQIIFIAEKGNERFQLSLIRVEVNRKDSAKAQIKRY